MKQPQKQTSVLSISIRIMIPCFCVLVILFVVVFNNLQKAREVAYSYMMSTADLRVDDISADIDKINSEIFKRGENHIYSQRLPKKITPASVNLYAVFNEIVADNTALRSRYGEEYIFYFYSQDADFLISGTTIYYKGGYETALSEQMRKQLNQLVSNEWRWSLIYADDKPFLLCAYAKERYVYGCYIDLQLLLGKLEMNNMGYRMIPYIRWKNDELISNRNYSDVDEMKKNIEYYRRQNKLLKNDLYNFTVSNLFEIEMVLIPDGGILEDIVKMQFVLLLILAGFMLVIGYGGCYLYLKLLKPVREFVVKLQNPEAELFLNNTETFNVTELEKVSKEFKELLRRVKTLKIAVYEKELMAQQVQLEYVQEQMQSHFYLNCMSILHGMAEQKQNHQMTHFLKLLSEYMRYVNNDSCKMKTILEELDHIRDYIAIQQFRYNNAFTYEADVEDTLLECYVPALLLQTFVENSVKHAMRSDRHLVISVYITTELHDEEEYLYIVISDTGGGFSEEVLKALEENRPIYYENRVHVGIVNIIQRLKLIYGDRADLKLSNMGKGYGAVVQITLPLIREYVNESGDSVK